MHDNELTRLADKWRSENGDYPESKRDCADELEAAVAQQQGKAGGAAECAHTEILTVGTQSVCEQCGRGPQHAEQHAGVVMCIWSHDADTDAWATGCGNLHVFSASGPSDNDHRFCPYCGGNLVVAPQPKDAA